MSYPAPLASTGTTAGLDDDEAFHRSADPASPLCPYGDGIHVANHPKIVGTLLCAPCAHGGCSGLCTPLQCGVS